MRLRLMIRDKKDVQKKSRPSSELEPSMADAQKAREEAGKQLGLQGLATYVGFVYIHR